MEKNCKHPIENIMSEALQNLKNIVDISTVVGDAIKTPNGTTIVPISKVTLGYIGGGGEYVETRQKKADLPFASGSGAGLNVQPIGFLIEENDEIRYVQTNTTDNLNRLINITSDILKKIKDKGFNNEE